MAEEKPGRTAGAIETTGDLRALLAEAMTGAANGTMDPKRVDQIIKLAKLMNESIRDEIRLAKKRAARGEAPVEFGRERLPKAE